MPDQAPPLFPNQLRVVREDRMMLTREGLHQITERLAQADSAAYTRVGLSTIRNLEFGLAKPNRRTMVTLAAALETPAVELFPLGPADPVRRISKPTRKE